MAFSSDPRAAPNGKPLDAPGATCCLASRTKNWFGNQKGEKFEYHLLTLALAIPIMIRGAGAFSIDRALSNKSTM
jgi:uncharacterized membrane protein YphA (DoxX/SURF4 family)